MKRLSVLLLLIGCGPSRGDDNVLRVGVSKIRITPETPVMLAGYASRNKPSEGVAEDLWARAVAIDDIEGRRFVIVTADVIGFGPTISRRIKQEAKPRFQLQEDRLLLVGSHTHSGPVISDRALVDHPEQMTIKNAYIERLYGLVLDAIDRAIKDLSRASDLRFARGEAKFGMYRRVKKPDGTWGFGDNPDGPLDPDVPVLFAGGKAVLYTYACHCTSVRNGKDGFYKVHPDYAKASALLEARYPSKTFLYVTGCGGDIDPAAKGAIDCAEQNAKAMADAVAAVIERKSASRLDETIGSNLRRIALPLEAPSRPTLEKIVESGKPNEQKFAKDVLAKLEAKTLPAQVDFPVHVIRFGDDLTMVALGGETCVEYALRLKRELGASSTWVVGYANEVMCYIPSERVLQENGYESGWSLAWGRGVAAYQMSGSGWPTPFALGLEDRIVSTVHAMLKE